jgi:hypothetical protein
VSFGPTESLEEASKSGNRATNRGELIPFDEPQNDSGGMRFIATLYWFPSRSETGELGIILPLQEGAMRPKDRFRANPGSASSTVGRPSVVFSSPSGSVHPTYSTVFTCSELVLPFRLFFGHSSIEH